MSTPDTCFHCTEKLVPGQILSSQINEETHYFCCPACLAIAQTIHSSGLDDYYCQRTTKAAKAQRYDFSLWNNPALQQDFVETRDTRAMARLYIEGLHCTSCAWLIEKHLLKQTGIISASLNYQQQQLQVSWDISLTQLDKVMEAIANIGYLPHPYQADKVRELQQKESKTMLKQIGITGILMMQIGMFSIGIYAGDFVGISTEYRHLLSIFSLLFSLPLLYFSALPFFTAALLKLRNRQLSIDVSISIAIIGLYASSVYSVATQTGEFYFDSIAMFCLFVLIARYIEKQSRMSLMQPSALLPAFAMRKTDGKYQMVPASELRCGDTVLVRPGETIAIDGEVVEGKSSVGEAFLNGEPLPLPKKTGDTVYAGSTNHDGELIIRVINETEDTFVRKIEHLSQQAAQAKPGHQNLTDRIAARFTSIVYMLAISTFIFWYSQGNDQAFWIALSVLVISCPCALSLAAPTALSTVQYTLRQSGILVQSAQAIEKLHNLQRVIFDKTGTLTEGRYSVTRSEICASESGQACLQLASALEAHSRHPIAQAFTKPGLQAEQITLFPNQGIEGKISSTLYRIGSPHFCSEWHEGLQPPDEQQQWLGLCNRDSMLCWFALADPLRDDAPALLHFLHSRTLQTSILSGDSSSVVDAIAQQLEISDFRKGLTSAGKLDILRAWQARGEHCLMIGDGVNDAPVLAQSDVSATLLHACDWVRNSTDVVLLNNRLGSLQHLIQQAHRYHHIVWQNFAWALLYNSLTIPVAMAGLITPYWAAIGMSLSSVVVVINSRRLKKRL